VNLMVYGSATSAPEEVRHELERILASSEFAASDRNRRFLRHVVEEKLSGRGDRIKAYSIATSVFGRSDDFDPLQDSIVRIEAARLRRAIERFYLLQGDWPGLRILIPKGTYVPEFLTSSGRGGTAAPDTGSVQPAPDYGPRILVEPFEQEGDVTWGLSIGRRLTRQVISALTRFAELSVHGLAPTGPDGAGRIGEGPVVDYRLSCSLTLSRDLLHAELLMHRVSDGRFVWAQDFDRAIDPHCDTSHVIYLCGGIAAEIARAMALRDGILDSQVRESADAPHFAAYRKLLDFHDCWRRPDPSRFESLRRDLEAAIVSDPGFSSGLACLSLLYSNAARFGCRGDQAPPDRALDLARQAIRFAPCCSRAHHARAVAEWVLGQPETALETLRIARALNPNDPEVMAELGLFHAMRMEWDSAVPLLEEVFRRHPDHPGPYRMGLFLHHFAAGRHDLALHEAQATASPGSAHMHLAAAAALAGQGRQGDARLHLDQAERLAPEIGARLAEDPVFRNAHPALIEALRSAIGGIGDGRGLGWLGPQGLAS